MKLNQKFEPVTSWAYLLGGPKAGEFIAHPRVPKLVFPFPTPKGMIEAEYEVMGKAEIRFGTALTVLVTAYHEFANRFDTRIVIEREVSEMILYEAHDHQAILTTLLSEMKKELLHGAAEIFTRIDEEDPMDRRLGAFWSAGSSPWMYQNHLDPRP